MQNSSKPPIVHTEPPLYVNLLTGAIAGVVGASVVFPLDLIKTRLQNNNIRNVSDPSKQVYKGAVDCFRSIVQKEGFKGLYRGLSANLIGIIPEKAIKLSFNDYFRQFFGKMYYQRPIDSNDPIPLVVGLTAGGLAGFCQVVASNPMEITKINLQMSSLNSDINGVRRSAFDVAKELGFKGLYKGSSVTLLRDIPFSMIYFSLYGYLKDKFQDESGQTPFVNIFVSSVFAGSIASALSTPSDVIKTRYQSKGSNYASIGECYRQTVSKEGYSALWKGVTQRVAIISPLFGITVSIYEIQKRVYTKMKQ